MGRVGKFLALPPADKRLLLRAGWLLVIATVGLRVMKLEHLRRMLAPSSTPSAGPRHSAEHISLAVGRASRAVPGATCVPQAIAAEILLKSHGYPAHFHVGVSHDAEKGFQAHAWVESDGVVAVGGPESPSRYASLAVME